MENLLNILLLMFVLGVVLLVVKMVFKLTTKILSCGCLFILAVGLVLFALGAVDLPAF
jgi:hypothetical protein